MYADDTKVYRELSNLETDTRALQSDIDRLNGWATLWHLRFNPVKCETMRITHNRDKSLPSHTMGPELKSVKNAKDLGVLISSELSWSAHVDAVVNKANKVLGVVHRTLGPSNQEAFSILYETLVRPILELCSLTLVSLPGQRYYIRALERVQRRNSRLALGQKRTGEKWTTKIGLKC